MARYDDKTMKETLLILVTGTSRELCKVVGIIYIVDKTQITHLNSWRRLILSSVKYVQTIRANLSSCKRDMPCTACKTLIKFSLMQNIKYFYCKLELLSNSTVLNVDVCSRPNIAGSKGQKLI